MMGVEHIYGFDNRRIYPAVNESVHYSAKYWGLKDCILRPFLDANLTTLVHFPFAPDRIRGAINSIQNYHVGVLMQQFGHYYKYIGIFHYNVLPLEEFPPPLDHASECPASRISGVPNAFRST